MRSPLNVRETNRHRRFMGGKKIISYCQFRSIYNNVRGVLAAFVTTDSDSSGKKFAHSTTNSLHDRPFRTPIYVADEPIDFLRQMQS